MVSLTFENLKILSSSNQSSEKAKILAEALEPNYMRNGEDLYKMEIQKILLLNKLIDDHPVLKKKRFKIFI